MRCEPLDNRSNRGILFDIDRRLETLERMINIMVDQLARLQADVAAESDQITAAETLLSGLAAEIRNNAGDPTALSALADSIEAKTAELAASITANTPAAPASSTSSGPANGDPNTSPAPAPAGDGTTAPAPADGSTSGDQTPA